LSTDCANNLPARAVRLTGAELAECIITTDLAVMRDRMQMRRARRAGVIDLNGAMLCAAACGHTGAND